MMEVGIMRMLTLPKILRSQPIRRVIDPNVETHTGEERPYLFNHAAETTSSTMAVVI